MGWRGGHILTVGGRRLDDVGCGRGTFHFHALEKEMATHSSVLAWRIPGTGSLVDLREPLVRRQGRRAPQPTPVCLPRESHGQRGLVGYHP